MIKLRILFICILPLSCLSSCSEKPIAMSESYESQQTSISEDDTSETDIQSETDESTADDSAITYQDFTGITFSNASFVYDGEPKSIYVNGAPEFATVTYEGNEKTGAGAYTVKAHITAENYNPLDLSATLTITKADFTNITFESQTFDYDGNPHSIYVEGAPSEATVTYTNNGKSKVGTYTVTAKISSPNYNTLNKTATLRILGKVIEGVTFSDQTFEYDGKSHSIKVDGEIPSGVSASYTNNNKVESGTYEVVAKLTGEGYEPLELKAKLIIKPVELDKPGYFSDTCVIYDGQNHSLVVDEPPSYATVTYKCLNVSGTNTFKKPGQYDIEATVKINNNNLSVLRATLFIIEEGSYGVDPSKTALTIDENLKWDELHEALSHDNFTFDYYESYYDVDELEDPRPSDILEETCANHRTRFHFATDGKQAYSKNYSTYSDPYYSYTYYKEVGGDIACFEFNADGYSTDIDKFPKAAFSETVCKPEAANAFVALRRGDDDEFLPGVDGDDYYKDVGYPFIQDNKFIVLMEHPRTLDSGYRYFYEIYEFYNIGNTKVTLPDSFEPSKDYVENSALADYRLGGAKYRWSAYGSYSNIKRYYSVELYVSYATKIFLEPGTYTVLPFIYDNPVMAIVHYSYYNQYYNYDQSGYTFNLYIDEEGDYQGEYAYLGSLGRLDIREFTSHDGEINYYADWHE